MPFEFTLQNNSSQTVYLKQFKFSSSRDKAYTTAVSYINSSNLTSLVAMPGYTSIPANQEHTFDMIGQIVFVHYFSADGSVNGKPRRTDKYDTITV